MRRFIFAAICILISTVSYAQFYGDVTFDVKDTGDVVISGQTNYEPFKGTTDVFTSKEGEFWLLNISTPVFEDYIYHIQLPKYAVINYLKSNSQVRIEEKSGSIIITSTGRDKKIELGIQYTINKQAQNFANIEIIAIIMVAIVVGIAIKKKLSAKKIPEKVLHRELFTDRQLMILDYLKKHGSVTQAELEKALKLPKSSLSRNVDTLVQKGIIFKETKGMSNIVGFKEQ